MQSLTRGPLFVSARTESRPAARLQLYVVRRVVLRRRAATALRRADGPVPDTRPRCDRPACRSRRSTPRNSRQPPPRSGELHGPRPSSMSLFDVQALAQLHSACSGSAADVPSSRRRPRPPAECRQQAPWSWDALANSRWFLAPVEGAKADPSAFCRSHSHCVSSLENVGHSVVRWMPPSMIGLPFRAAPIPTPSSAPPSYWAWRVGPRDGCRLD